jgi:hypothetical protein
LCLLFESAESRRTADHATYPGCIAVYAPPFPFTSYVQAPPGQFSWGHEAGVTFVIGSFFAGILIPDEVLDSDTLLSLQEKVSKKARLS